VCNAEITTGWNVDGEIVCDDCHVRIQDYTDRVQARIERLEKRAEKTQAESKADQGEPMDGGAIPRSAILIGHHSEGRDAVTATGYTASCGGADKHKKASEQERRPKPLSNRAVSSMTMAVETAREAEKLRRRRHEEDINVVVRVRTERPGRRADTGRTCDPHHRAQELLKPDFAGRYGFPDYALRNNGSEIRRLKERIADLQVVAQQANEPSETEEVNGWRSCGTGATTACACVSPANLRRRSSRP
jgi:hypothetical protein